MVDFPLRSVDKEVHQLKLTTIITERGGVGGCSRNLCNPHSNLSGMFTGILQKPEMKICLDVQKVIFKNSCLLYHHHSQFWLNICGISILVGYHNNPLPLNFPKF